MRATGGLSLHQSAFISGQNGLNPGLLGAPVAGMGWGTAVWQELSGRRIGSALTCLLLLVLLGGLTACPKQAQTTNANTGQVAVSIERSRTFVSWNFFSMDYPADWATRDLEDGANLFYSDEMLFVGVKIYEAPDAQELSSYVEARIKADADVEGGQATLVRTGNKGPHPFYYYMIVKPNGLRYQDVLIVNQELKLVYVITGRSRAEDFDEFSRIFDTMFESFQFRVTGRIPSGTETTFQPDVTTMSGVWMAYMEGLRAEDYDLLQKSCARVNSSKIINDATVRKVRNQYFPYNSPVYTFISQVEVRERLAIVTVAIRALPPEGFLKHEVREFIKEEDHWRLLRFERAE